MTTAIKPIDGGRKREKQYAKWKSVDSGTAGMKDYTKDTMWCPARPQKSRNESDSNKWR